MTTEQLLLERWHSLPVEKQKEVLDFVESLRNIEVPVPSSQPKRKRRFPPPELAGKARIVGDIVGPIVDEEDWECLKL
jgi:hypothetical protein